jgi:hypothetical protein
MTAPGDGDVLRVQDTNVLELVENRAGMEVV